MEESGESLLPLCDNVIWFNALCTNNIEAASKVLASGDKDTLINGYFTYPTSNECVQIECPATVATCHGAFDVLKLLMEQIDDVNFVNRQGYNVVHALIRLAVENPEDKEIYIEQYHQLRTILGNDKFKLLLLSDASRERPLELACLEECLSFVKVILETPEIYLVKEEYIGMQRRRWYDITDYESLTGEPAPRSTMSPLRLLSFISNQTIALPECKDLLFSDPIDTWSKAHITPMVLPVILWFLMRLTHFVFFIFFDFYSSAYHQGYRLGEKNITDPNCGQIELASHTTLYTTMVIAVFQSTVVILFDLADFVLSRIERKSTGIDYARVKANMAANTMFYRGIQVVFSVSTLISMVLVYTTMHQRHMSIALKISYIFRLIGAVTGIWSLLFFLQLLPAIGIFVIIIQHMLRDLFSFSIVYVSFLFPFTHVFMIFLKSTSATPCLPAFANYGTSAYQTFLTMLNMVSFEDYAVTSPDMMSFIHISYFFVMTTLLLNFLIALFSNTVSVVMVCKQGYSCLEKLAVASALQRRLGMMSPCLRRLLIKFFGHTYVVLDGKVCLLCVSQLRKEESCQRKINEEEKQ